jgi:DNA-directed RNA polymerase specialized sigma24 family protein
MAHGASDRLPSAEMERLFELYAAACRAAALGVNDDPDLADEVVQQVFSILPEDLCTRVQEESMVAYFRRAGVNAALRFQRRRSREVAFDAISGGGDGSHARRPIRCAPCT